MTTDNPVAHNEDRQIRILAICWIIHGVARLFAAVCLVSFSSTTAMMFEALLARVRDPLP